MKRTRVSICTVKSCYCNSYTSEVEAHYRVGEGNGKTKSIITGTYCQCSFARSGNLNPRFKGVTIHYLKKLHMNRVD